MKTLKRKLALGLSNQIQESKYGFPFIDDFSLYHNLINETDIQKHCDTNGLLHIFQSFFLTFSMTTGMVSFSQPEVDHILRNRTNLRAFIRRTFDNIIFMLELPETPNKEKKSNRLSRDKTTEIAEVDEMLRLANLDDNNGDGNDESNVEKYQQEDEENKQEDEENGQDDEENGQEDEGNGQEDEGNEQEDENKNVVLIAKENFSLDGLKCCREDDECVKAINVLTAYFPKMCDEGIVFRVDGHKIFYKVFDKTSNDSAFIAFNEYQSLWYFIMKDCFRAIHVLRDYFPDINNGGVCKYCI